MKITNTISAALVLGSLLVAASSVWAGEDALVWVVDFPADDHLFIEDVEYAASGESVAIVAYSQADKYTHALLYRFRDGLWETLAQDSDDLPMRWLGGMTSDGSVVSFYWDGEAHIADSLGVDRVPDSWVGADGELIEHASIISTAISGDGSTVAIRGYDPAVGADVPLIWDGGGMLQPLGLGVVGSGISNTISALSNDGRVIVGYSTSVGRVNDIRDYPDVRAPWILRDGQLTMIPFPANPKQDSVQSPTHISADGSTVAGFQFSPVSNSRFLTGPYHMPYLFGPTGSWVWSAQNGTVEIADPRFEQVIVRDISADGSTLLVIAIGYANEDTGAYLWSIEHGFESMYDIFVDAGVSEEDAHFYPESMSDDAKAFVSVVAGPAIIFIRLD